MYWTGSQRNVGDLICWVSEIGGGLDMSIENKSKNPCIGLIQN